MFTVPRTRNALINPIIAETLAGDLNDHEMAMLSQFGTIVELPAGQQFATEGAVGQEAVVVVSGSADVVRAGETIATVGAGAILGEAALLTGAPRNASLVANSDLKVSVLNAREFASLLNLCPRLEQNVNKLIEARAA